MQETKILSELSIYMIERAEKDKLFGGKQDESMEEDNIQ